MHKGLVPVVTKECFADTGDWGIQLKDVKFSTLKSMVKKLSNIEPNALREKSTKAYNVARSNFTQEIFSSDMGKALEAIIKGCKK